MENLFHFLKGINEKKFLKNNKFKWLFTFGNVVHLLHICSHEIVIIGTGKRGKIRRGMGIYLLGNQVPCTGPGSVSMPKSMALIQAILYQKMPRR